MTLLPLLTTLLIGAWLGYKVSQIVYRRELKEFQDELDRMFEREVERQKTVARQMREMNKIMQESSKAIDETCRKVQNSDNGINGAPV